MKSKRPLAPYDFHLHTRWSYDATAEVEEHFRRELGIRRLAKQTVTTSTFCRRS